MNENDVKPLFTEDPNIMDTENAFRPVSFDRPAAPVFSSAPQPQPQYEPEPQYTPPPQQHFTPPPQPQYEPQPQYTPPPRQEYIPPAPQPAPQPVLERPIAPVSGREVRIQQSSGNSGNRASGAYYLLLLILVGLSIFTLYLYQEKMNSAETPHIAAAPRPEFDALPEEPVQPRQMLAPAPAPVAHIAPAPAPAFAPAPAPAPVAAPTPFPAPAPIPAAPPPAPAPAFAPSPFIGTESFYDPVVSEEFLTEDFEDTETEGDFAPMLWPEPQPAAFPVPLPIDLEPDDIAAFDDGESQPYFFDDAAADPFDTFTDPFAPAAAWDEPAPVDSFFQ